MLVGELLSQVEEQEVTLKCGRSEDSLHYSPPGSLTPELVAQLKARKKEVIRILRDDDEYQRTLGSFRRSVRPSTSPESSSVRARREALGERYAKPRSSAQGEEPRTMR